MLKFAGDKDLPQAPSDVWSKLSDARFLAECIPGRESVRVSEPRRLECTLRPGFAFVRGTLELTLEIVQAVPDSLVELTLKTRGIGTTSEVAATLTLTPQGSGTHLHWDINLVTLGGLLKAVPQGLLQAAAQKVIGDALSSLETKL
jgi:carbon monoxide dehydrogenase subunit G